jgi:hypothetical protein
MSKPEPLDVFVPKFNEGEKVWKHGAGYSGPGEVAVSWRGKDGHVRYVVEHQIEGGEGWFFHVYGESQLTRLP